MNGKLINLAFFTLGAVVGVGSTYYYFKNKYDEQARLDLEERLLRDTKRRATVETDTDGDTMQIFTGTGEAVVSINTSGIQLKPKPDLSEYAGMVKKMNYTEFSAEIKAEDSAPEVIPDDDPYDPPYIINPEDFGENEDYELVTLTYYSDGVLTDGDDELIEDVDGMVGYDSLSRFKDFKVDCIYVRNDRLESDYEIISDLRRFDDVLADGLRHRR